MFSQVAVLRIVYFGTPQFAVPALEALIHSRHNVVALVSQPDRPKGRGHHLQPTPTKVVADAHGVPVQQPTRLKDGVFAETLRSYAPDLGVVAAYGRILPDDVLAVPRLGMINIHASVLPKYRGAAPVHRAVINGDPETGVTIMRVVTELDSGPVFAVERRAIGANETTPEVERALAALGARLVVDVVDRMAAGEATEVPQDHAQATYASKIERHEGAIDWTRPAVEIQNLVRGLQPWPLVSARVNGVRCLLHRTELTDQRTTEPGGTVVTSEHGALVVACGDGRALRILEIQPEGKRAMSARDFLAGHKLSPGARFEAP
jgi:methionyl-tRNA formyltransferase